MLRYSLNEGELIEDPQGVGVKFEEVESILYTIQTQGNGLMAYINKVLGEE